MKQGTFTCLRVMHNSNYNEPGPITLRVFFQFLLIHWSKIQPISFVLELNVFYIVNTYFCVFCSFKMYIVLYSSKIIKTHCMDVIGILYSLNT